MERSKWLPAFVLLFVAAASGQHSTRQGSITPLDSGCADVYLWNGPYKCINGSSCGTYYTVSTEHAR
jgi:hypothetical protein